MLVTLIRLLFLGLFKVIGYFAMRQADRDIYFNREYARPKVVHVTSHGLSNFRKLVMGKITLEEWRKARVDTEVKEVENPSTED